MLLQDEEIVTVSDQYAAEKSAKVAATIKQVTNESVGAIIALSMLPKEQRHAISPAFDNVSEDMMQRASYEAFIDTCKNIKIDEETAFDLWFKTRTNKNTIVTAKPTLTIATAIQKTRA